MLDFSKLKTPPTHGSVLVEPKPETWSALAHANSDLLRNANKMLLGKTLGQWRQQVRTTTLGQDHSLVVVTGHQPAFIHPGVWAKHVVAARAAQALQAIALNLIVDNDAVNPTTLAIPTVHDAEASIERIRFANCKAGTTYEQLSAMPSEVVAKLANDIAALLGDRYNKSQWPKFFSAINASSNARDWVDQQVLGRQAIENSFGVSMIEQRISNAWCTPLVADVLHHAKAFATCYNTAIANYRRTYRVRGAGQPIPTLETQGSRCEVPLWVYRNTRPRQRLFVDRTGHSINLYADRTHITSIHETDVRCCEAFTRKLGDWRIRPRALSLTLWARLLLADLFVHGIGGAKYDRITDDIIEDYYQVKAPAMACVSATMHIALPTSDISEDDSVGRIRQILRDMRHNPQRHLPSDIDPEADTLVQQRQEALALSNTLATRDPSNRAARRDAFNRVRQLNAELFGLIEPAFHEAEHKLQVATANALKNQIARNRDLFFGHFDDVALQSLLDALPATQRFAV